MSVMGYPARMATTRKYTKVVSGGANKGAKITTGSTSATRAPSTRQRQMPQGANKGDLRHGNHGGTSKGC